MSEALKDTVEYESPTDIANRYFNKLRCDLAVRSDNAHVGSSLGGNPTEYWFMLNHNFVVYADNKVSFSKGSEPYEVVAHIPYLKNFDFSKIRKAFSDFVKSHPNKVNISKEDIENISFLKDLIPSNIHNPNARAFIKAMEIGQELASWLDTKIEFNKKIKDLFSKEDEYLQSQFLQAMNLPQDYFKEMWSKQDRIRKENPSNINRADDPNWRMFVKHPIWGVRRNVMAERQSAMEKVLLSQEDKDKMTFLGSLSPFLALQVIRSCIGIERIVYLNLDEDWPILAETNNLIK